MRASSRTGVGKDVRKARLRAAGELVLLRAFEEAGGRSALEVDLIEPERELHRDLHRAVALHVRLDERTAFDDRSILGVENVRARELRAERSCLGALRR